MKLALLFILYQVVAVLSTPAYRPSRNEDAYLINKNKQNANILNSESEIIEDYENIRNDRNKTSKSKTNIRDIREKLLDHLLDYIANIIQEHYEHNKEYNKDLENKFNTYYSTPLLEIDTMDNSNGIPNTLQNDVKNNVDKETLDYAKELIIPHDEIELTTTKSSLEKNIFYDNVSYDSPSNEKFHDDIELFEESTSNLVDSDYIYIPLNVTVHGDREGPNVKNLTTDTFITNETDVRNQERHNSTFVDNADKNSIKIVQDREDNVIPKSLTIKSTIGEYLPLTEISATNGEFTSNILPKIQADMLSTVNLKTEDNLTSTTISEIEANLTMTTVIETKPDLISTEIKDIVDVYSLNTSTVNTTPIQKEDELEYVTNSDSSSASIKMPQSYDTECQTDEQNYNPTPTTSTDIDISMHNGNENIKLDETDVNLDKKLSISIKLNQNSTLALLVSLVKKLSDW